MGSIFSAIERRIIETSAEVCRNALINSAKEIQEEIRNEICYQVSQDYYDGYEPKKYKRIPSLFDVWDIKTTMRNNDALNFHLNLNSDNLPRHESNSKYHQSGDTWISRNSSKFNYGDGFGDDCDDNGIPDNGWILKNFFEGIHPIFVWKKDTDDIENRSVRSGKLLDSLQKYIFAYRDSGSMSRILIRNLKIECSKL